MGAVKSRSYASYKIHHDKEVDSSGMDPWADGDGYRNDSRSMAAKPTVKVCKDEDEILRILGYLVEKKSNEAIRKTNRFTVAVSGGSLPKYLCQILPSLKTEWSKWTIFFCDERIVPFNDPESTYGIYREKLLGVVPISDEQIVKIDPSLEPKASAANYAGKLAQHFPDSELPNLDMVLLGLGPDGHTCSLFPDHPLLREQGLWVASIEDSPKPPPCRITLTLPILNSSGIAIFVCTGEAKAEVVKQILEDQSCRLPGALVKPVAGELHWILDSEAGQLLSKP